MKYKIKSRIWIEADGEILLGEGRVALLHAINDLGSLSKAAKSLNMSYKKAWSLIDALNPFQRSAPCRADAAVQPRAGGDLEASDAGRAASRRRQRQQPTAGNVIVLTT